MRWIHSTIIAMLYFTPAKAEILYRLDDGRFLGIKKDPIICSIDMIDVDIALVKSCKKDLPEVTLSWKTATNGDLAKLNRPYHRDWAGGYGYLYRRIESILPGIMPINPSHSENVWQVVKQKAEILAHGIALLHIPLDGGDGWKMTYSISTENGQRVATKITNLFMTETLLMESSVKWEMIPTDSIIENTKKWLHTIRSSLQIDPSQPILNKDEAECTLDPIAQWRTLNPLKAANVVPRDQKYTIHATPCPKYGHPATYGRLVIEKKLLPALSFSSQGGVLPLAEQIAISTRIMNMPDEAWCGSGRGVKIDDKTMCLWSDGHLGTQRQKGDLLIVEDLENAPGESQ